MPLVGSRQELNGGTAVALKKGEGAIAEVVTEMNKLFKIFFLTLIVICFTACGNDKSSNNKSGGSNGTLYSFGNFVPGQFVGANGQITDVPGYCNYIWDYTYDQVIVGLVETYRTDYQGFSTTISTETLSKTADSYTQRVTYDGQNPVTTTHTKSEDVNNCIEAMNNPQVQDPSSIQNMSFHVNMIAQRTEAITVQAGTYQADYTEFTGSISFNDPNDGSGSMDMHMKSWTGKEGLAKDRTIKSETTGAWTMDGQTMNMDSTIELIELFVR